MEHFRAFELVYSPEIKAVISSFVEPEVFTRTSSCEYSALRFTPPGTQRIPLLVFVCDSVFVINLCLFSGTVDFSQSIQINNTLNLQQGIYLCEASSLEFNDLIVVDCIVYKKQVMIPYASHSERMTLMQRDNIPICDWYTFHMPVALMTCALVISEPNTKYSVWHSKSSFLIENNTSAKQIPECISVSNPDNERVLGIQKYIFSEDIYNVLSETGENIGPALVQTLETSLMLRQAFENPKRKPLTLKFLCILDTEWMQWIPVRQVKTDDNAVSIH